MKKMNLFGAIAVALVLVFGMNACKPKDADVKAAIEKALQAEGMTTSVSVEKGVATLSGECKDDACKAKCESIVKGIKGVKSVANNCTVTPPPAPQPVIEVPTVSAVEMSVKDALKDFPNVTYELTEGAIKLKGEVAKAKLMTLMQTLQGLNLKVDSKELIKK